MLPVLPAVLAAALAAPPDAGASDGDPDDAWALVEVLRREHRRAPPPCEERAGWLGDDDPRDPAPCDDDEDSAWLVPAAGPAEGGSAGE